MPRVDIWYFLFFNYRAFALLLTCAFVLVLACAFAGASVNFLNVVHTTDLCHEMLASLGSPLQPWKSCYKFQALQPVTSEAIKESIDRVLQYTYMQAQAIIT